MNRKVLCVDDEENVLRAFERNLRLHFEIETAVGPAAGLSALERSGPYAVVISDLRMPGMDGIQFLTAVKPPVSRQRPADPERKCGPSDCDRLSQRGQHFSVFD
jgi:DNA-binding NtrC family response regulator